MPRAAEGRLRDLPELELECMKVLWESGELSVRAVRDRLLPRRSLAYTTILTVLDRLAHKGVVTRRKAGRAHLYQAAYSLAEARQAAVSRVLQHYFGGSRELLAQHLGVLMAPQEAAPEQDERAGRAASLDTSLL
jgi:BlaI family penicillinase repressor